MYLIRRVIGTFTEFAANVEVTNHSLVLVILLTRYTGRLRELFIMLAGFRQMYTRITSPVAATVHVSRNSWFSRRCT